MLNRIYLEKIFHKHYTPLCNYAAKIINDDVAAEDIVQSLFIQLYEKDKLANIENIERYLLRSTKFKCIDHLRILEKTRNIPLHENIYILHTDRHEITEEDIEPLFHYYAAKLPPKTQKVFLLSRKSKLTYKEIAAELNISVKTVENQMSRAIRKMKDLLKDNPLLLLYL